MEIGGIRVKFRWVGGGIPTPPHKSNFHQTLSIKDFYVGYLPFKGFLRIVLSIYNNHFYHELAQENQNRKHRRALGRDSGGT